MTFRLHQRIRVTMPGPFRGYVGTVVRFTYRRSGVWVKLDEWPPGEKRPFDEIDDERRDWQTFNDDECEIYHERNHEREPKHAG